MRIGPVQDFHPALAPLADGERLQADTVAFHAVHVGVAIAQQDGAFRQGDQVPPAQDQFPTRELPGPQRGPGLQVHLHRAGAAVRIHLRRYLPDHPAHCRVPRPYACVHAGPHQRQRVFRHFRAPFQAALSLQPEEFPNLLHQTALDRQPGTDQAIVGGVDAGPNQTHAVGLDPGARTFQPRQGGVAGSEQLFDVLLWQNASVT